MRQVFLHAVTNPCKFTLNSLIPPFYFQESPRDRCQKHSSRTCTSYESQQSCNKPRHEMRLKQLYNCPPQWNQERDCGSTLVCPSKCHMQFLGCQWLDFNKTLPGGRWRDGWRLSFLHCGIFQITLVGQIGAVQLRDIHIMHSILNAVEHIVTEGNVVIHLITSSKTAAITASFIKLYLKQYSKVNVNKKHTVDYALCKQALDNK